MAFTALQDSHIPFHLHLAAGGICTLLWDGAGAGAQQCSALLLGWNREFHSGTSAIGTPACTDAPYWSGCSVV